jgi:Cytochrome P460
MRKELMCKLPRFAAMTITGVFALLVMSPPAEARKNRAMYTVDGELLAPNNYRQWVFVGAPVTPNDMNNGTAAFPEFHHVYINPAGFAYYKKTGKFRDGTVIVKELATVGSKSAASGNGYFPGEFTGLVAAVKDGKRYAREPGHWAYFSFTGEGNGALTSAVAQPSATCNACHQKNGAEDWVFTQFYPVLRAAKKTGPPKQ